MNTSQNAIEIFLAKHLYIMDLYELSSKPEVLDHYNIRETTIPKFAYLKAYEIHSMNPGKRFIEGEPIISTNGQYSTVYALYVLNERFLIGEDAIKSMVEPRKLFHMPVPSWFKNEFGHMFLRFYSYKSAYEYFFNIEL